MTKELVRIIVDSISSVKDSTTVRDETYNKIARNQPAYITLLFPLIGAIIILNKNAGTVDNNSVIQYIFNYMTLLLLFLPAVFYLYKHIIRVISELFVEIGIFKIWNPNYAPYNISLPFAMTEDEIDKIKLRLYNDENINFDLLSDNRRSRNKEIKKAIKYIREKKCVRDNNIVFENNCVYGFFRNLVGGIVLNLILFYSIKLFNLELDYIKSYIYYSIRILWILLIVFILMAWYSRFRHIKRESILYYIKSENDPDNS